MWKAGAPLGDRSLAGVGDNESLTQTVLLGGALGKGMGGLLPVGKLLPQGRGHVLPSQRVVETLDAALQLHLPNTTTNRLLQTTTSQKSSAAEGETETNCHFQCCSITTTETMELCFRCKQCSLLMAIKEHELTSVMAPAAACMKRYL